MSLILLSIRVLHQDKGILVGFFRDIPLVVNEMVDSTCLGRVGTRKVLEIETFLRQLLATGKALPGRVQFQQDIMVTSQDAIYLSYYIDLFVSLFVVVAVAARVTAEFLVNSSDNRFTAVEAFSFFHSYQLLVV